MAIRTQATHGSYYSIPDEGNLDISAGDILLSCVFRIPVQPTAGDRMVLVTKGYFPGVGGVQPNYGLDLVYEAPDFRLRFYSQDGSNNLLVTDPDNPLTIGRWYMLFGHYKHFTEEAWMYMGAMDGPHQAAAVETTTIRGPEVTSGHVPAPNAAPLTIGSAVHGTTGAVIRPATADICEVALYDDHKGKVLIDAIFVGGLINPATASDLKGYWRADEFRDGVGGGILHDRSGNGNDGVAVNQPTGVDGPTSLHYDTGNYTAGVIGWHNHCHTIGSTVAVTDEDSSYVKEYLFDPRAVARYRTDDVTGAHTVTFGLNDLATVGLLTIDGHNLTSKATITIAASKTDSWGSPDLAAATVTFEPRVIRYFFPRDYQYQWWRISITDAGNSDGYISLGVIGLWQCYEPTVRPDLNDVVTLHSTATATVLPHGDRFTRSATEPRSLSLTWSGLPKHEAFEMQRIDRSLAMSGYAFLCPDVKRSLHSLGIMGSVQGLGVQTMSNRTGHVRNPGTYTILEEGPLV